MKIISKFKDFYDFEVARYGEDEKLVYRRTTAVFSNSPAGEHSTWSDSKGIAHRILLIGDELIHLFSKNGKVYTHFDLTDLESLNGRRRRGWGSGALMVYIGEPLLTFTDGETLALTTAFEAMLPEMLGMDRNAFIRHLQVGLFRNAPHHLFPDPHEEARLRREPIVLIEFVEWVQDFERRENYRVYRRTYNPNLQALGIFLAPDLVWQRLVAFLSKQKSEAEIMPPMTDAQKIDSHGFDRKTSFRPNMKKKG